MIRIKTKLKELTQPLSEIKPGVKFTTENGVEYYKSALETNGLVTVFAVDTGILSTLGKDTPIPLTSGPPFHTLETLSDTLFIREFDNTIYMLLQCEDWMNLGNDEAPCVIVGHAALGLIGSTKLLSWSTKVRPLKIVNKWLADYL